MSYCLQCGEDRGHLRWCDDYRPQVIYSNTTPRARTSDPETSHHAAGTVTQLAVTRTQNLILEALRGHGPLTDEELCFRLADAQAEAVSVSGVRTRRSELVTAGHVVDTGRRKPTRTGRTAIVWGIS